MEQLTSACVQNDDPKDDCEIHSIQKEIIKTSLREKDWIGHEHMVQYEGFWHHEGILEQTMAAQKNFESRSIDDILLSGHMKTGTTWLKALSFAIATRSTFLDMSSSPLLIKLPHDCIPNFEFDHIEGNRNANELSIHVPLISTHLPYTSLPKSFIDSGCKIVYIWRDPKDVFVSLWYFMEKFQKCINGEPLIPLTEAFDLFCRGINLQGPYWDHVLTYWKVKLKFPEKILFLKYEEMKKDTKLYVEQLADFIGYRFTMEEQQNGTVEKIISMCSFENLSELAVNKSGIRLENSPFAHQNNIYFRKAKVGDWENELTPEMRTRIDAITDQKFRDSGLIA